MTFQEIVKIHERLFPNATLAGQWQQFGEELSEYLSARTVSEALDEFGDLLFVIISIMRWDEKSANHLLGMFYFEYPVNEQKVIMKRIEKAIKKVEERCSRNLYVCDNGHYTRKKIYSIVGDLRCEEK